MVSHSNDSLAFECAVVTGGGGGIGKAIAQYFISKGKKVLIAGRTESNLQSTAKEIGAAGYYVLDTGKTETVPGFVEKITTEHPELDCIVNNAGVQRPLDAVHMEGKEYLSKADQEIDINIRGPMHLALGLLPHFRKQPGGAIIMNVSSVLGFFPFSVMNPVYCGTKAWMHFWTLNLRTQLDKGGEGKIKVIEIVPPAVGTDLHRDRADPDDNKKDKNKEALTVEEFMKELTEQLEAGKTTISAGPGKAILDKWYGVYGEDYSERASAYKWE